jgi:two-component system, LuxR family, response regulator FixJ
MTHEDGTVFLIDDDAGVRDSLSLLLSLKNISTQPFASADSFLESYTPERSGCVLTDLRMPGMTGLELQTAMRERRIELPIVVFTAHGDVATARAALKNGAFDFLEKPVDEEVLLDVLRNALRVDRERRSAATQRSTSGQRRDRLTEREREILKLLTVGHSNREIAAQLGISPRTVEVHKARIMEKLECHSLAELIRVNVG